MEAVILNQICNSVHHTLLNKNINERLQMFILNVLNSSQNMLLRVFNDRIALIKNGNNETHHEI
jgi:cobyrinic acid a,c-diamide synthase